MKEDSINANKSLILLDTAASKKQSPEEKKLTVKQKIFLDLLCDPECAELQQKFVNEAVDKRLIEKKKIEDKKYNILVSSLEATVALVKKWKNILEVCKQQFQKISGTPISTSIFPTPLKELEVFQKHLKSLTDLNDESKSLLLQQTIPAIGTTSAEIQPRSFDFSKLVSKPKKRRLEADQNNEVAIRITNDLIDSSVMKTNFSLQECHQIVTLNDQPTSSKIIGVTTGSNQSESVTRNLKSILAQKITKVPSELIDLTLDSDDDDDKNPSKHVTGGNRRQQTDTDSQAAGSASSTEHFASQMREHSTTISTEIIETKPIEYPKIFLSTFKGACNSVQLHWVLAEKVSEEKMSNIVTYELFSCTDYHPSKPKCDWRKIGEDILALQLPMVVTVYENSLKQKLYFVLRGRDKNGSTGPFSNVCNISDLK